MLVIGEEQAREVLPWKPLAAAIAKIFREPCSAPLRQQYQFRPEASNSGTLLVMPSWQADGHFGVKVVTVVPENNARGLPAVSAQYLLGQCRDGRFLAAIDGDVLTVRRTAATSALAASYLAKPGPNRLLIVGSGRIARALAEAYVAIGSIAEVLVWSRTKANAEVLVRGLKNGCSARVVDDLQEGAAAADIVSTATLASVPLIRGEWIRPGTHLDLVGAFKPSMREVDGEAVRRSTVFVDTRQGALKEAGDLLAAIGEGVFRPEAISADLGDLVSGRHPGRRSPQEITLFKSVGAAQEDLAAAALAYARAHPTSSAGG